MADEVERSQSSDQIKVLLIEDNPGYARLVKYMLAEATNVSFHLEWKPSLKEGLERIEEGGIDIILLDLTLPDSPRQFKTFSSAQAAAKDVPIIVLTSFAEETFAINAVRKGAQDYLVKRNVDSDLLVRTIRYAIARWKGEEKSLTILDLKEANGKEGKPAYIAFKGKVYDVTRSRLWKDGIHLGSHFAGQDLTEKILNAPHGEEVFLMFHMVGALGEAPSIRRKILAKIEKLRLHPITVHFSLAYSIAVPLFSILYLIFGVKSLELASFYMLVLGFLSAPFSTLTGVFSWMVSYQGKMNHLFRMKFFLTFIFLVLTSICFTLRILYPGVLDMPGLKYLYCALLLSIVPTVIFLGHYGGKIVYS